MAARGLSKTQAAIRAKRLGLPEAEIDYARAQADEIEKTLRSVLTAQHAIEAHGDFLRFIEFTSPAADAPDDPRQTTYKAARHHKATARVLEQVERGEVPFLILVMPPRHGKSEQVSRRLPAWFMGRNPHLSVIVATYNDDFAMDFGSEVRTIMKSQRYRRVFPKVAFEKGGSAKDRLKLVQGGQATFVGRGGSLTGRGGHLLICDDLIKDAEEARSKAIRDSAWNWFTKVAMTRRMGKKLVIMTFTRWHADDPIGRLTDPENEYYSAKLAKRIKIIHLPAIAEEDDPLGRAPGEALWPDGPDRYDIDFLEEQRALDPLGFEALYQGRPSIAGGDLFKRDNIQFYETLPDSLRFYCASDHAVAEKQRSDFTVLLKGGIGPDGTLYLVDCWWQKAASDVVTEAMLAMGTDNMAPLIWWAESGHISKSIGPFLRKRMQETNRFINLVEVTPAADKVQRAQAIAARVAMGRVRFPRDAWWTGKALDQLMSFPNGLKDDFVDALAWLGLGLQAQTPANSNAGRAAEPKYGTLGWVKQQQRKEAEDAARAAMGGF